MPKNVDEIKKKLDAIKAFSQQLEPSSYRTLTLIYQMIDNPAKEALLEYQYASINELLDTFIGLNTAPTDISGVVYIAGQYKQYVPETTTLSPSHTSTQLRAEKTEIQTFKELADYRAELNRQARHVIESQESEIRELHEVIKYLLEADGQSVLDACRRGESGIKAVQDVFYKRRSTSDYNALLTLSQSEFGRDTNQIIEDVAHKRKVGKAVVESAYQPETYYQSVLRSYRVRK